MTATASKPKAPKAGKATERPATTTGAAMLTIERPDFRIIELRIEGTAPLVINRFSAKAMEMMRAAQEAGGVSKSRKVREPKNFEQLYQDAKHVSTAGWEGFSAPAIRNACISACKTCGVVMTRAKLALVVLADGVDLVDGTPLIRIDGTAEKLEAPVRNATGVIDIRARPIYREWAATLRIRYDAGMFDSQSVVNLLVRVGMQVGIGEGRPDSKDSCGMGWGLFDVV